MASSSSARRLRTGLAVGVLVGGFAAFVASHRPAPDSDAESASLFDFAERLELAFFDQLALQAARKRTVSDRIAFVQIDQSSLDTVAESSTWGSWPWPRPVVSRVVTELRRLGASVVVLDMIYPHTAVRGGNEDELFAEELGRAAPVIAGFDTSERPRIMKLRDGPWALRQGEYATPGAAILAAAPALMTPDAQPCLVKTESRTEVWLGGFRARADALAAAKDLHPLLGLGPRDAPVVAELTARLSPRPITREDVFAEKNAVAVDGFTGFPEEASLYPPVTPLAISDVRFGNVSVAPEVDGVVRRVRHLIKSGGHYYPSLSLATAMFLAHTREVTVAGGRLRVGDFSVPIDDAGGTILRFYGRRPTTQGSVFRPDSPYPAVHISEVLKSADDWDQQRDSPRLKKLFREKIVFVSATARGLADRKPTPISAESVGTIAQANALDNLLNSDGMVRAHPQEDAALAFLLSFLGALVSVLFTSGTRFGRTTLLQLLVFGSIGGAYLYWVLRSYEAGLWVGAVVPLSGFAAALSFATALNYADETKSSNLVKDALGKYTSPVLVKQILENPQYFHLDGEQRVMTVFFSDIRDFTTISEHLKPAELVRVINDYLTETTEVVARNKGHVDKFIGDAIMAYWGAPLPNPLHAVDACRCALQLRDLLDRRRAFWKQRHGVEIYARAGINTGEMVVGNMGARGKAAKVNYTVIGDAVNLASRLEGTNKTYGTELLVGEGTFEATRGYIEAREIDVVRVKGKHRPVRIFELMAMKGELPPAQKDLLDGWAAPLIAYRKRDFAEALKGFEALLARYPSDGPSKLYVTRCKSYLADPPGEEWDGVYDFKEK